MLDIMRQRHVGVSRVVSHDIPECRSFVIVRTGE